MIMRATTDDIEFAGAGPFRTAITGSVPMPVSAHAR